MEKEQGFFSGLKDEVIRGLSPFGSRSRSSSSSCSSTRTMSPMSGLFRNKKSHGSSNCTLQPEQLITRSGSMRSMVGMTLTPLIEGLDPEGGESERVGTGVGSWMKGQLSRIPSLTSAAYQRSDLSLLLGVMGAPLAPVHVSTTDPLPHLSIKDTPIENSTAQYILQQFTAATGGQKLQNSLRNAYVMGKLRMIATEFETPTGVVKNRNGARGAATGRFVLWQMNPDMWYVELTAGGSKVHAGCNGHLVWRHTPWLGAHTAKGPVRPLRRALQGLDPRTTASMFADAKCIGEKKINGEDCFILKLCADPQTLKARSECPAEIVRHVLFGYFSQKAGLLVHMEDSHLTRIQSDGGDAVYWETTINSFLNDYRPVEGIMIAHSGRSVVTLYRFGEMAMSHSKTKMEETWTIEEVVFNVPGLSVDCFIPPADLRSGPISDACQLPREERGKTGMAFTANCAKVAVLEKSHDTDNMIWKMNV